MKGHNPWIDAARFTLAALATFAALAVTACQRPPAEPVANQPQTTATAAEPDPAEPAEADDPAAEFAAAIEEAHGLASWRVRDAVQTDIVVDYGGRTILDGRMTIPTDLGGSRLRLADGTIAVFDGESAWVSPAAAELRRARFHLLTWPYFLAAPMKLRDPGTRLELLGDRPLRDGEAGPAARLTFEPGVGDSPDDWYVVYRDPATDRLHALAYIVTYGTSLEEAEAEPHAVVYSEFVDVDGVQIPTTWTYYLWDAERGIHGEPIGEATLSGVRFVTPAADAFSKPEDAREDPLPLPES